MNAIKGNVKCVNEILLKKEKTKMIIMGTTINLDEGEDIKTS